MTHQRWLVAALALVALGVATLSRPSPSSTNTNAAVALDVHTPAPAPVASVLRRACFDCHSEQTRWPWYAQLPVASHLIATDVRDGRALLNWSRWTEYNPFDRADLLDKACELVSMRKMPPWRYRVLHSDAQLTSNEISEFCRWTQTETRRLTQGAS